MPIYEYKCRECGLLFEALQKVSDPPPECKKCAGAVEKLVSRTSFQLKGSGWYITDYAKKNAPAKSESPAESGAAGAVTPASAPSKSDDSAAPATPSAPVGGDAKPASSDAATSSKPVSGP